MNDNEPTRIALLIPQDIGYGRGVLQGIYDQAVLFPNWRLHHAPPTRHILSAMKHWYPHGVIAHVMDQRLCEELAQLSIPVVNTTSTISDWSGPLVEVDNGIIGKLAAEHFLDRGYRHFGYLGSDWAGFSLQREASFRDAIGQAGFELTSCYLDYLPQPPVDLPWNHIDREMRAWLQKLPKPVAVLASNDRPGREVVNACESLGLGVPADVAVLGVDNDEFECWTSHPPLSSIVNPSEQIGREAAALMAKILANENHNDRFDVIPQRLVIRQSTDAYAVDDPHLKAALQLIRQHYREPLSAVDVHRHVDCSRRLLERRFREVLGRSIVDEIRRVRIQRATELLADTDLKVAAIAERTGFEDARVFAKAFRRMSGLTPTEYRRQSSR
ncbi:MAG: substrate-binding domain-containing protein [Planctomycetota bacterium]